MPKASTANNNTKLNKADKANTTVLRKTAAKLDKIAPVIADAAPVTVPDTPVPVQIPPEVAHAANGQSKEKPKKPVKQAKTEQPAKTEKPAKAEKEKSEKQEKPVKAKLVRDSFTMPEAEYAVLSEVKKACLKAGIEVKKSELLRIGVAMLRELDNAKLKERIAALAPLKTGRPKKHKAS